MDASTALQVFVSPLLGTIYDNLGALMGSQFSLTSGVDEELESLSNTLLTIQDVLEDAEMRQITVKSIRNWLKRLKDVAYEADDLLDECRTDEALRRVESDSVETNESFNSSLVLTDYVPSFSGSETISSRHALRERIKKLRQKFAEIAEQRSKFDLNTNVIVKDVQSEVKLQRETSSFLVDPQVYGRDEDKEYIVNLLLNHTGAVDRNGPQKIHGCAIQGMGGLGKTTLAQMVYHDERIVKHFEYRCWVCISENFDIKTILRAMIESSGQSADMFLYLCDLNSLQCRFQEIIGGKRFLLVLDDVWNDDQALWKFLKSSLRCGGKGSSIIVTTRLEKVASLTGNLAIRRPKLLSEEACWSLFKHQAFDMDNKKDNNPNLEVIGKAIVKKCGGIPLAAKALGGLLRFKRKENEWLNVRDSEIWDLPQHNSDSILPALRLSYNNLPIHCRQCFALCSIFPKNYIIKKEMLIHLWMANGFVPCKGKNMEFEDVGDEIFNDLSCRSFFQDFGKDKDGNILWCKMHDLVHDLACSITKDECCVFEVGDENINVNRRSIATRYLSLVYGNSSSSSPPTILEPSLPTTSPHIRTIIQLRDLPITYGPPLQFIYTDLKCLRALDLSRTMIRKVPNSIGNLKHLRYLNLSGNRITSLPNESFCSLINLQILILNGCYKLGVLPKDMSRLSSLRHLDITGNSALTRMPTQMGKLIYLQTLSFFIVGAEDGCGITELRELNHLRGELVIKGLQHVTNSTDATISKLKEKPKVHSLKLFWSDSWLPINITEAAELHMVGEGLQPHPNIKKLHIEGYGGRILPSWLGSFSCLPNLVELSLVKCKRCENLLSLGELPFLKILITSEMDSVKRIGNEFHHHDQHQVSFPALEELTISGMPNLEEFSSSTSTSTSSSSTSSSSSGPSTQLEKIRGGKENVLVFPYLRNLTISECPKLGRWMLLPASLEHIEILNCPAAVLSRSLESFLPSLTTLLIRGILEPIFFPQQMMLQSLTSLTIWSCSTLDTLPKELTENLPALAELKIIECHQLVCLPENMDNLKSLNFFSIQNCHGLKTMQDCLPHLTSLKMLHINSCPQLEFLCEDFQHLIALQDLTLVNLPKMTSLPIVGSDNISATLQYLEISKCPGMTALPKWIINCTSLQELKISNCKNLSVLPEGFQQLTSLLNLEMRACHPDLHKRCHNQTREDWHKIAHIPRVINQEREEGYFENESSSTIRSTIGEDPASSRGPAGDLFSTFFL